MAAKSYRKSRQPVAQVTPTHKRYPAGKYRRVALIYLTRAILLPAFVIVFTAGMMMENQLLKTTSLILLGLSTILTLMFWASANSVICRLCKTPMLKHLKCAKKKGKIPNFLGDRSLATAISLVLRRPNITCQYCAERHKYFD